MFYTLLTTLAVFCVIAALIAGLVGLSSFFILLKSDISILTQNTRIESLGADEAQLEDSAHRRDNARKKALASIAFFLVAIAVGAALTLARNYIFL